MEENRQIALQFAHQLLKEKDLKFYKLHQLTERRFEIQAVYNNSFIRPLVVQIFEIEIV